MGEIIFALFVIIGIFFVIPIFICLWFWYDWRTPDKWRRKRKKIYRISYKRFKIMYSICPNNWKNWDGDNHIYYQNYLEDVDQEFYFNFIDYIRFRRFLKKEKIEKMNREQNERMAKVLKCFQTDIDIYNKRNMEYLEEKIENISSNKRRF